MTDFNRLMDDLAIDAFETNIKIASLALISKSGKILYQSKNWDLSAQTNVIFDAINGNKELFLNNLKFSVIGTDSSRIVATNKSGKGSIVIITFGDRSLISYVMPGANTDVTMDFLLPYAKKICEIQ